MYLRGKGRERDIGMGGWARGPSAAARQARGPSAAARLAISLPMNPMLRRVNSKDNIGSE